MLLHTYYAHFNAGIIRAPLVAYGGEQHHPDNQRSNAYIEMANSGTLVNRDQGFAIADCMLETDIDPS